MSHPLVVLVQIRQKLDSLKDDELTDVLKYLIGNNCRSTIISGLFYQLYQQSTSIDLLNDILLHIDRIKLESENSDQQQRKKSEIIKVSLCDIPNNLLSNIASYLSLSEILTQWNHVNRHFLEIGMKPETILDWDFDTDNDKEMSSYVKDIVGDNPPKFKVDSLLTRLKSIHYNRRYTSLVNLSLLKSLKHVRTGLYCILFLQ